MEHVGWLSLIPAIATILVAVFFRKVATALLVGIIAGSLVISNFNISNWLSETYHYLLISFTDFDRIKIVLFILLIGGLLEMISFSGAYNEFANVLSKKLNTPRKSRLATWGLSFCMFFDDYANVLISGASMRSINDRNKVSPAILAYMVDVVAIMASIMLISTWAAYEGSLMVDAGKGINLNQSMTTFFLESLPYHFYTFIAIALSLLVAYTGKWFGYKIDKQQFSEPKESKLNTKNVHYIHVLAPILTLLTSAVLGLFVIGISLLIKKEEPITLINILGNAPSVDILIGSTVLAILVCIYLLKRDKVLEKGTTRVSFRRGVLGMISVSLVIILATGLSAVSQDLGTGKYIADSLASFITPPILPAIIFVISMLITVATGFSWSSMAIVMPIAYQLVIANNMQSFIPVASAAVISGAIAGEHMIPFSEKTVMTAAACGIPPIYHTKTQIFQTLAAFISAIIGFLLLGFGFPLFLAYLISFSIILIAHFTFAKESKIALKKLKK